MVGENEIRHGIKLVFEQHRQVIEGAAGVVVASFLKMREKLEGKKGGPGDLWWKYRIEHIQRYCFRGWKPILDRLKIAGKSLWERLPAARQTI